MTLTQIALQNLRRRFGKTIFLILTFLLVVGTITTLNIVSSNMKQDLQQSLSQYGANIMITPKSEHLSLSYGGLAVSGVDYEVKNLEAGMIEKLEQVVAPGDVLAPKIIGSAKGNEKTFLIVGVDFAKELQMKPWWKIEGQVPKAQEVVVGFSLATENNFKIGDSLNIGNLKLKVSGVMQETGGSEDNAVFTDFQLARDLTGIQSEWSMIELNVAELQKILPLITENLPEANIASVSQLVQSAQENVDRFADFSVSISIALVVIGVFVIVSALAGNVNDRVRELGILRAIGFRQSHVLSLLGREALILSFVGSLLGYLLGILLPFALGPLLFQKTIPLEAHVLLGALCIFGAMINGLIAMIYPAWRVTKLDPQEALRFM
ncbi:ABC transporter permease [Desulfitobacterium metallireducens]|uniref:ABC transporter permease n=1 Tax=Desulfitobacterium metallireducens DSM 15288 TaxID=871968 RepID=W0E8W7_9FIRM|nr:FtsX-like permease family protein [Desulfitobacterium metallireducens]AHF05978.1 ABC transporter permease [Desulfitobacterium metallireducens DSM 15288]